MVFKFGNKTKNGCEMNNHAITRLIGSVPLPAQLRGRYTSESSIYDSELIRTP